MKPIGESRSQAVRRFLALERSLNHKSCFQEVNTVIQEYFDLGHAQEILSQDLDKDPCKCMWYTRAQAPPPRSDPFSMLSQIFHWCIFE